MARSLLQKMIHRAVRGGTNHARPVRIRILLALLIIVSLGAAASQVRTWWLEKELLRIAEDIIREHNTQSSDTSHADLPAGDTTCKVYASPQYVLFGAVTGKIVFLITPSCGVEHKTEEERLLCSICSNTTPYELDYLYRRGDDGWVLQESSMCRSGDGCR